MVCPVICHFPLLTRALRADIQEFCLGKYAFRSGMNTSDLIATLNGGGGQMPGTPVPGPFVNEKGNVKVGRDAPRPAAMGFDSEALYRGANALRVINESVHAKKEDSSQFRTGGGTEIQLTISPQESGPLASDNFVDSSSSPLTDEVRKCDWSCSGAESEDEQERLEGGEGLAKRLRTKDAHLSSPNENEVERRVARAWDHWRKLGEPKMHVAPMVDQSELPFRMLCRQYGATAAYTPMLHARLFAQDGKYRTKEFTTCPEDRPLFVQFCANNPDTLLEAARLVEQICDYVDINLGCPQRIAKKGYYGAFLMENLPLVKSLVSKLASNLAVPVSCKIRVFPDLEDTLAYAKMLEEAGCSLLAVHGRTRDQKDGKSIRADWDAIRAVKKALRIPVLGNGNIRWVEDVHACIEYTGVDGVMSAESLLENPALFAGYRPAHTLEDDSPEEEAGDRYSAEERTTQKLQVHKVDERALVLEYLNLCEKYPVPMRMVRGHVHKMLGNYWFKRNPDIRQELNKQHTLTLEWLKAMVYRLMARPPGLVPPPSAIEDAGEAVAVADADLRQCEYPGKPLASGIREVLPLLTCENNELVVNQSDFDPRFSFPRQLPHVK